MRFLDWLDDRLRRGEGRFSAEFWRPHVSFALSFECPGGGFRGRRGGADIYYTDFAVRLLSWLSPDDAVLRRIAAHAASLPAEPRNLTECFNRLNIQRLLLRRGVEADFGWEACRSYWEKAKAMCDGPYQPFLCWLCGQTLGFGIQDSKFKMKSLPEWSEGKGYERGLTSLVAAGLVMGGGNGWLSMEEMGRQTAWLRKMQAADGGVRAHPDVACGDLLSTFNGLTAAAYAGRMAEFDLPAMARFARCVLRGSGGFAGSADDPEADLEFTYYGLGTLALLAGDDKRLKAES
ncbi:MAG: prenyltransferase/squalene oxidase repeat-containing protein [Verrucomicrobiae bacterium]|nr:prenyltransferase/squalene oxidase repeat-containing protein [Verrucomicrobiae bacterium]